MKLIAVIALFFILLSFSCGRRSAAVPNISLPKYSSVPYPQIHFPFDQDDVPSEEMSLVDTNAKWLRQNSGAVVILEGHCDEAGPANYNMELGDKRARTVKEHLITRGVPHDRIIMVVSFGDTRPLDVSHTPEAWRKNRRVELVLR